MGHLPVFARNGCVRLDAGSFGAEDVATSERNLATYRGALRQAHDAMMGTSACARA